MDNYCRKLTFSNMFFLPEALRRWCQLFQTTKSTKLSFDQFQNCSTVEMLSNVLFPLRNKTEYINSDQNPILSCVLNFVSLSYRIPALQTIPVRRPRKFIFLALQFICFQPILLYKLVLNILRLTGNHGIELRRGHCHKPHIKNLTPRPYLFTIFLTALFL